jgi:hypothetical protein
MLIKKIIRLAGTLTLYGSVIMGLILPARAEDIPSVEQIVSRVEATSYYQGKDGRAHVNMQITDGEDRVRHRRFIILRRDQEQTGEDDNSAGQKYFVLLKGPADVRNTVFMVWKHPEKDDDRWLYLPALDLVKRIVGGDKRTSFLGSDFFYEDISGRSTSEDTHELTSVTDDYFVLKNVPKLPDSVEFSYYVMWVHRDSYIPVKVEYFDQKGEKYRVYDALSVKTFSGYPTVTKSRITDMRINSTTVLEFNRVEYDMDIPEDIFSERYLRKPPMRYLR